MIKLIGLDYFGTVACHYDGEEISPFRNGLDNFFDICEGLGIKIAITSDKPIEEVRKSIERYAKNNTINMWVRDSKIWARYHLPGKYKNFRKVIVREGILPSQLLVIGDDVGKDVGGALDSGAHYQLIKPYNTLRDHDNLGWGMTHFSQIVDRNKHLFLDIKPS